MNSDLQHSIDLLLPKIEELEKDDPMDLPLNVFIDLTKLGSRIIGKGRQYTLRFIFQLVAVDNKTV